MVDVEKWDFDDAKPVAALENGGIGPFVGDPGMFHDVPLVDAQTDSELARAYLLHAELALTTLKSTTTEVGAVFVVVPGAWQGAGGHPGRRLAGVLSHC